MKKVVVGLSGGVDSAVCAARLQAQGYAVTGLFLQTGSQGPERAREVSERLRFPLLVAEMRDQMLANVITPFAEAYVSGRTPNPCVLCNPTLKFPALLSAAAQIGADYIATGHYVQTKQTPGGTFLQEGVAPRDQSYMLYRLSSDVLAKCLFPIGTTPKEDIRAEARALGLTAAETPDSMEICFVPDDDYATCIEALGYTTPVGNIVDTEGRILGRHRGLHHYTLGQRRHIGIATKGRVFVVALDTTRNEVVLGDDSLLYPPSITLADVILAPAVTLPLTANVRVRHSRGYHPALVTPMPDNKALVTFTSTPARAPTPGQSCVLYQADVVLGGGIIT